MEMPRAFRRRARTVPAPGPQLAPPGVVPASPSPEQLPSAPPGGRPGSALQPAAGRTLVAEAWRLVSDRADELVRMFYAELFHALGDEAFAMFPSSMVTQRTEFGRALIAWVVAEDPAVLFAHLDELGADHRKFGVEPAHYDVAGRALVNAWSRLAGDAWTPQLDSAVLASFDQLASIMIGGALAAANEPACWDATVVAHERPLPDFAVLRVRPELPYPFRAGQYLTVEAPALRNEWRAMSIASAPRLDNTLDLHVRAIGASGVSGRLVMRTRPGDRLRLGPPRGVELVVEPGTAPGGLLCVCSGTGAAPIVAVTEAAMGWPQPPPVHVYVGGRTSRDLHVLTTLGERLRASGRAGQVRLQGVLSDEPSYAGLRGRVEEVVPTARPWAQLGVRALIAGSDSMITALTAGLMAQGVRPEMISADSYELGGLQRS